MSNHTEPSTSGGTAINVEPTRSMVEPEIEPQRELSTGDDGEAKQPQEDSPAPDDDGDEG